MTGAGSVLALVLTEWTAGWVGAAAWTQSWGVVRRGHFRITAWIVVVLAGLASFSVESAVPSGDVSLTLSLVTTGLCALYLIAQYLRSDVVGVVAGGCAAVAGGATLVSHERSHLRVGSGPRCAGADRRSRPTRRGDERHDARTLVPEPTGPEPWALARLTQLSVGGVAASGILGLVAVGRLTSASTEGAVLGFSGFGDDFGVVFFVIWLLLLGFTGVVVWAARRCVKIRSIQSATGLYYVAILTAGVSEFLVRYLMVNAS